MFCFEGNQPCICATGLRAAASARSIAWLQRGLTTSAAALSEKQADTAAQTPAFHAYVDFKALAQNPDAVAENCQRRAAAADPHLVAQLYREFVELSREVDALRAERNRNATSLKKARGC